VPLVYSTYSRKARDQVFLSDILPSRLDRSGGFQILRLLNSSKIPEDSKATVSGLRPSCRAGDFYFEGELFPEHDTLFESRDIYFQIFHELFGFHDDASSQGSGKYSDFQIVRYHTWQPIYYE